MLNAIYFYMEQPTTGKYHRSNRSSPALMHPMDISQHTHHHPPTNRQDHLPPLSPRSTLCSAYFLTRIDLNNYTIQTLQQAVDNVVSGPKSKGRSGCSQQVNSHFIDRRIKGEIILAR